MLNRGHCHVVNASAVSGYGPATSERLGKSENSLHGRSTTAYILILAAVFLYGSYTPALQRVEELGYLAATRWMPEGTLSSKVAVVAIDQQALQRIGPWPWSRDRVAVTVDRLRRIGVRAVGLLLPLHEPETSPKLAQLVEETAKNKKLASAARAWAKRLDTDAALETAVAKSEPSF